MKGQKGQHGLSGEEGRSDTDSGSGQSDDPKKLQKEKPQVQDVKEMIDIYETHLKDLFRKCKIFKSRLDIYHCTLYKINSIIQLSVIYFSATSTFIQAFTTGDINSNDSFDNVTIDETPVGDDSDSDNNGHLSVVDTITLGITSYSSLIVALARHFKIEERVGNVYNLIERFAEILS